MTTHPPSFRLDGYVAGDADDDVRLHLASCEACSEYVAALAEPAAAFAARAEEEASAVVAKLEPRTVAIVPWRRRAARTAWIATPLLAAAGLLLLLRGPSVQDEVRPAPAESALAIRFKGKVQLSIVRDRGGDQARVSGQVSVLPGDRLRVEVGVDAEQPIEVGMLGDDGTWIVLLAPTLLEAGAHLSERAARFDDTPTEGVLLAGHPEAVERARSKRVFDEVTVVPVVRER